MYRYWLPFPNKIWSGSNSAAPNKIQNEYSYWSCPRQWSKMYVQLYRSATIQMPTHYSCHKSIHWSVDINPRQTLLTTIQFPGYLRRTASEILVSPLFVLYSLVWNHSTTSASMPVNLNSKLSEGFLWSYPLSCHQPLWFFLLDACCQSPLSGQLLELCQHLNRFAGYQFRLFTQLLWKKLSPVEFAVERNGFVYVSIPVLFDLANDFFCLQENIIGKF